MGGVRLAVHLTMIETWYTIKLCLSELDALVADIWLVEVALTRTILSRYFGLKQVVSQAKGGVGYGQDHK